MEKQWDILFEKVLCRNFALQIQTRERYRVVVGVSSMMKIHYLKDIPSAGVKYLKYRAVVVSLKDIQVYRLQGDPAVSYQKDTQVYHV
jgi:hypothetical protein